MFARTLAEITAHSAGLHKDSSRSTFRGTSYEVVPSPVAMQSSMGSGVMSLEGPPRVLPKWGSRLQTKVQPVETPRVSITESKKELLEGGNASTVTLSQDKREFEAAVRPAIPRVFRFCLSLTGQRDQADDLLQNTLIKAYLNAASFEGRSEIGVWLCGIAWHEHLELRRTEARRKGLFGQFVDACSAALGFGSERTDHATPETLLSDGQNHSNLLRCLQTLPEDFRAVVILCDIEELGYERAAEVLGVPKGTVKSRHARGRIRLREAYEKLGIKAPADDSTNMERGRTHE